MDKWFTTEEGDKVSVIEHTLEQIQKWPGLKVYIATDSQDYGPYTVYATAVVYRYGTRGAHYIYFKEKVPRIRDMYVRLYGEGVRTIDTAELISSEIPISFEALEFDYNHISRWASNRLLSVMSGWAKALNYNPVFKNSEDHIMIAAKAADHIARNK